MTMTRPEMVKKLPYNAKYVSDVESGRRKPSEEYVCKVTGLLGLSTKDVREAIVKDSLDRMPSTENVIPFGRI